MFIYTAFQENEKQMINIAFQNSINNIILSLLRENWLKRDQQGYRESECTVYKCICFLYRKMNKLESFWVRVIVVTTCEVINGGLTNCSVTPPYSLEFVINSCHLA